MVLFAQATLWFHASGTARTENIESNVDQECRGHGDLLRCQLIKHNGSI